MSRCRVVAGPGSGKTRVLISRIAHLLHHHQVPAYQVLAITFTNKVGMEEAGFIPWDEANHDAMF